MQGRSTKESFQKQLLVSEQNAKKIQNEEVQTAVLKEIKRLQLRTHVFTGINDVAPYQNMKDAIERLNEKISGAIIEQENVPVRQKTNIPLATLPIVKTASNDVPKKKSSLGIFACLFPCCGGGDKEKEKEVKRPLLKK